MGGAQACMHASPIGRETNTNRTSTSNIRALLISERVLLAVFIFGHCYSSSCGLVKLWHHKTCFLVRWYSCCPVQSGSNRIHSSPSDEAATYLKNVLFSCRCDRNRDYLRTKRRPTPTYMSSQYLRMAIASPRYMLVKLWHPTATNEHADWTFERSPSKIKLCARHIRKWIEDHMGQSIDHIVF